MKKFFAVLLALVLALSMSTVAFAATGSITINNAVNGEIYSAYRIFDLESFVPGVDGAPGAYSYKTNTEWAAFVTSDAAKAYVNVDENDYVTWVEEKNNAEGAAEFAKLAIAYAETNSSTISAEATATGTNSTATMTGLDLGYYLVNTTVGTICALTTTALDAVIEEKHETPTVEKKVEEDSDKEWYETDDADIGQTVNFKSEITLQKGIKNYVLHDKMDNGLTITTNSVVVVGVASENYTVDYAPADACTFHVTFTQAYLDSLANDTVLTVTYSAVLNENAVIAGTGNLNETWTTYGNAQESTHDTTTTYTYKFDLNKVDDKGAKLDGAKFELYRADAAGNKTGNALPLVAVEGGYRMPVDGETTTTEIVAGSVSIMGLDSDKYVLVEKEAPTGYNKIADDIKFEINDANLEGENAVKVINKTGSLLPETGGIGTTIFYVVGISLMLGAVILLITKKKKTA